MSQTTTSAPDLSNCITHTEFATSDIEAAKTFFNKVLSLKFDDMSTPEGPYHVASSPNKTGVALRPTGMAGPDEPPNATPYFSVANLDKTIEAAKKNGAKQMVPKMPVPKMGWFSWFQIPGGNIVAFWQDDVNAA